MEYIGKYSTSGRVPHRQRRSFTLIEVLAAVFVIVVPILAFGAVAPRFGKWVGIVVALISAVASVKAVVAFYRWAGRLREPKERD